MFIASYFIYFKIIFMLVMLRLVTEKTKTETEENIESLDVCDFFFFKCLGEMKSCLGSVKWRFYFLGD